jgi:hypothetical protein
MTFVSFQAQRILGYPVEQWLASRISGKITSTPMTKTPLWRIRPRIPSAIGPGHDCEYRMIAADGQGGLDP